MQGGKDGEEEEESDNGLRVICLREQQRWYEETMVQELPPNDEDIWWMSTEFQYNQEQARNSEYYGNEGCEYWYSAAVLLAAVPAWGSKDREDLVKSLAPK